MLLLTSCSPSALKKADPKNPLLVDLEEKSDAFDKAAAKYSAKAAA
jgi:coatomer protein complex subunit epsilon